VETGSYLGRRADFSQYTASVFNPYLFRGDFACLVGCGAGALALLSGIAPETVAVKNGSMHYSDAFMLRFLRNQGFKTLRLTLCNLSQSKSQVQPANVVLLSQLFRRNEATWGVVYDNSYYHNFQHYSLESISFLNKPILSAYLIVHPRWRMKALGKDKAELRSKTGRITWSALRKVGRKL
jgi:hypothetical protein